MKTLYFEGAGMDFYDEAAKHSNVGNFRIRTVFSNLDGKQIYLEMGRGSSYGYKGRSKKLKVISEWALYIASMHEVTGGPDDENNSRIPYDWRDVRDNNSFSKEDITAWINKNLNCDFETIEVIDRFYGYHTFSQSGYVPMEEIELNHERAAKRKEVYEQQDLKYRELLNHRFSVIGLQDMDAESLTIRSHASEESLTRANLPRIQKFVI